MIQSNLIQLNTNDKSNISSPVFCVSNNVLEGLTTITTAWGYTTFTIDHLEDNVREEETSLITVIDWIFKNNCVAENKLNRVFIEDALSIKIL